MKYKARPGFPFSDEVANAVGEFLSETFKGASYTSEDVLKLAKNPKCPLHKYYNWDKDHAAERHWLEFTRRLITCYYVVVSGEETIANVSFKIVDGDENRKFIATQYAMKNEDIWDSVLNEAKQGLVSWKSRYERFKKLTELDPVFKAINKVTKGDSDDHKEKAGNRQRSNSNKTRRKKGDGDNDKRDKSATR